MKKDTTELILDYVIRINTELLKTNARVGDIEVGLKDLRQEMYDGFENVKQELRQEMNSGFEKLRGEMHDGFEKADTRFCTLETDVKEISIKLEWLGEVVFVHHENRFKKLETVLI